MRLEETYRRPEIHSTWRRVYRSSTRQQRFDDAVYRWIFERLKPAGRWLDAGCGSGDHTLRLAAGAGSVWAVDISPYALEAAQEKVRSRGLDSRVSFERCALEDLGAAGQVDHVHCRGVLMHIPDWRAALARLCAAARKGGYVVIFESNSRCFEALLVRMVRCFQRRRSRMTATADGLEFWSESNGAPFLVRMTNLAALEREMRAHQVEPLVTRTIALFDLNRFPAMLRPWVVILNRLWYRFNLPWGSGVVVIGRKDAAAR